jgi:predicted nucleotidyltransferase
MSRDFVNLLVRLLDAKVDFVIIGGFAGTMYGSKILTEDIDICCDFQPDNLMRLFAAVAELHPVHRMTPQRRRFELTPETAKEFSNLYLDTDAGQLDCISEVSGVGGFEQVKQRSRTIAIQCYTVRVLDLDALIASKKAMGRPRDQEMVRYLETLGHLKKKQKNGENQ